MHSRKDLEKFGIHEYENVKESSTLNQESTKVCRTLATSFLVLFMLVTLVLQIVAFKAYLHAFLCSCILALTTITLVFDGILKDNKQMFVHACWYVAWFINLLATIATFSKF